MDKIVIFDWGGIVESHREGEYNWQTATINLIKRLSNRKYSDELIIEKWNKCNSDNNGKIISEVNDQDGINKWFNRIKVEFDLSCSMEYFHKIYEEEFSKVYFYKDVVEYAHSLKKQCKIGILSNLAFYDKDRINRHYQLEKFDYVWLSFELNCRKPDEKIYEIVEEQCKIDPDKILFIDDSVCNIETAKKRGWHICLANGYELDKIKVSVDEFLNGVKNEEIIED